MKKSLFLLMMILILPFISSIDLTVEKTTSNEVMVLGLDKPAIFELNVKNNGPTDSFVIYTFFGSGSSPKEAIKISQGETKKIKFSVLPPYEISRTGFIVFDYFIKGTGDSEYEGQILVKLVESNEVFEIGAGEIDPESNSMEVYIKNLVNFNFENLNSKFSSDFFSFEEKFSLAPKETKTFLVDLNKEEINKLNAGFYTMNSEVTIDKKIINFEGVINFAEKNILNEEVENYGFLIRNNVIVQNNDGNADEIAQITIEKNILSRLFTSFSTSPDTSIRNGVKVVYTWSKELAPGEELKIKAKTNWLLPLVFVILIVSIVLFFREHSRSNLMMRKKVTFVRAKGGEFALKVSILIYARERLENIFLVERFPGLLKLHQKFVSEPPTRVNEKTNKLEWDFKKLEAGEKRMITYLVYSKVGIVGRFAFPKATAIYERDGKLQESSSNAVFFVTEQKKREADF